MSTQSRPIIYLPHDKLIAAAFSDTPAIDIQALVPNTAGKMHWGLGDSQGANIVVVNMLSTRIEIIGDPEVSHGSLSDYPIVPDANGNPTNQPSLVKAGGGIRDNMWIDSTGVPGMGAVGLWSARSSMGFHGSSITLDLNCTGRNCHVVVGANSVYRGNIGVWIGGQNNFNAEVLASSGANTDLKKWSTDKLDNITTCGAVNTTEKTSNTSLLVRCDLDKIEDNTFPVTVFISDLPLKPAKGMTTPEERAMNAATNAIINPPNTWG